MGQSYGRVLRRRMLGREVRRYRDAAGLSVRALAPMVPLQAPGTISKIETGRQDIVPKTLEAILTALEVPQQEVDRLVAIATREEREAWWSEYADTVPDWFRDYVDLEGDADEIWTYSPMLVDGLLQTPEYAEAVARVTEPGFTADQLRRTVELREARQATLERAAPPRLHVILGEPAIHTRFGDTTVMRDQMRRLDELSRLPNVTIRVVPLAAGGHPGVKGGFTVLRFPDEVADADCVYIETETTGVWLDRTEDVARYSDVFDRLRGFSLSVSDTRDLLSSIPVTTSG